MFKKTKEKQKRGGEEGRAAPRSSSHGVAQEPGMPEQLSFARVWQFWVEHAEQFSVLCPVCVHSAP